MTVVRRLAPCTMRGEGLSSDSCKVAVGGAAELLGSPVSSTAGRLVGGRQNANTRTGTAAHSCKPSVLWSEPVG